jgi:octaprenyl-diphosphate synthase
MTNLAISSSDAPPVAEQNALEHLSQFLKTDMAQVNSLIIDHMQSSVPLIPQLAGYLIASGGKRIRPLMTLAATRLLDEKTSRPYKLAAAVEFIHTATLLHDDVVDISDKRRGKPSANVVFGNQSSVLVGDFLFSRAFELMVADGSLDVLRILSHASAVITEGEVLQLSIQNKLDTTLEQYLQVIEAKTAILFSAACEIGPIIANKPDYAKALSDYGLNLGMAFQIADDILDYSADEAKLGKTVGDDFREGKMTSPVIYALQNASDKDKNFWHRAFVDNQQTPQDLKIAQDLIVNSQAYSQTLELAKFYAEKAVESLKQLPPSPLKQILENLAFYAVRRQN